MSIPDKQILFEPWNMGDALIAAAVASRAPDRLILACNSRWHTLLRTALAASPLSAASNTADKSQTLELLAVDLDYVNRGRAGRTSLGTLPVFPHRGRVLSIRGDPRDYLAACRIFPHASSIRASGWLAFAARRSPLLDLPFARGWLPIQNQYRAWASMTRVSWAELVAAYSRKLPLPHSPLITVHVGAQWRSKQYPEVAGLVQLLRTEACVQIVAGPGDPVPEGVAESEVLRLVDGALIAAFRASSTVIVNDSGPMHLAAALGCQVFALCRLSSIEQWLPPATIAIRGSDMPKGYRPRAGYMSDQVLAGWPTPAAVAAEVTRAQYAPCFTRQVYTQDHAPDQLNEFPAD